MVSSWITPKAHKGVRSDIAGRGLFAVEPISTGEIVAVKGGHIVTTPQRDVAAGEELTTDYALFDDYDGQMECQCGSARCRGVIDGHDWRRPDLQHRHRGYFSWYLQRKIDESSPGPCPRSQNS